MPKMEHRKLPYRPFNLDTRQRVESLNRNWDMDFFTTLLRAEKLTKYDPWLCNLTYKRLLDLTGLHWIDFEDDMLSGDYDPNREPKRGGLHRICGIVGEMVGRGKRLQAYYKELENKVVDIEKLDEILKYLIKISYYPMGALQTENNVSGFICKILCHGMPTCKCKGYSDRCNFMLCVVHRSEYS